MISPPQELPTTRAEQKGFSLCPLHTLLNQYLWSKMQSSPQGPEVTIYEFLSFFELAWNYSVHLTLQMRHSFKFLLWSPYEVSRIIIVCRRWRDWGIEGWVTGWRRCGLWTLRVGGRPCVWSLRTASPAVALQLWHSRLQDWMFWELVSTGKHYQEKKDNKRTQLTWWNTLLTPGWDIGQSGIQGQPEFAVKSYLRNREKASGQMVQ